MPSAKASNQLETRSLQDLIKEARRLSDQEYAEVKKHPSRGFEILRQVEDIDQQLARITLQHHERIDGKGYPEGLRGNQIEDEAQIIALAECYEALTHPRPYRARFPCNEAMQIIIKLKDLAFENSLIKDLLTSISFYPIGSNVQLSNGAKGRIIGINKKNPLCPVVEITTDTQGNKLTPPKVVDLTQETSLTIAQSIESVSNESTHKESLSLDPAPTSVGGTAKGLDPEVKPE